MLLLRLLTFPLSVHFIDNMIANCRNVSLLILRRSCVRMCPNKLKALSTWHADRGQRTKKKQQVITKSENQQLSLPTRQLLQQSFPSVEKDEAIQCIVPIHF